MFFLGMCSVTFRTLSPREIVVLAQRAGLDGIEWGGDVHVPHGNTALAREVRSLTEDAGLRVASFGSYYRVGHGEPTSFERVLETAVALGAPVVRVWAGKCGSAVSDVSYWKQVVADSRYIADLAAGAGLSVAYEFHSDTLNDCDDSARALLGQVAHERMGTYWQIPPGASPDTAVESLQSVLPWLLNIHVFWWANGKRLPLAEGSETWQRLFRIAATTGRSHWLLLEFVRDDAPDAFLADARTLRAFVGGIRE